MKKHIHMKKKIYIVSFGDSARFRVTSDETKEKFGKSRIIVDLENELNDYLKARFPETNYTYYTMPTISEVHPGDEDKYASYPELDSSMLDSVKKTLAEEVEDMESNCTLNSNAPYSNI